MDLIKNNVIDVIEDSKRQCVEFQCQSNKSGKEVVEYLRSTLPEGVIKEVRCLFDTRDFEIETYTKKQTSELYKSVNDVLTGKVSHSVLTDVLGVAKDFGTTVLGSKQQAGVDKEKAKYESEAAIAKANADAQARVAESKNKVLIYGIGGALLIVAAILFVVLKN